MRHLNRSSGILLPVLLVLFGGCATQPKSLVPTEEQNPPPKQAFSSYSAFALKPIAVEKTCKKEHGSDVAVNSINEKLQKRLGSVLNTWNSSATDGSGGDELIIEPVCVEAKLIGGAARFFLGRSMGNSKIVMQVRYVDKETGETIADPEFFQRANGWGGAYTVGATDRNMLDRIVNLIVTYTKDNYQSAVGGRTGVD